MNARDRDQRGALHTALAHKALADALQRSALARLHAITTTDVLAIEHLTLHGPQTPSQLAARLGLSAPGTAALIRRLQRSAHITRHPHPADRRKATLHPTDNAHAFISRALAPPDQRSEHRPRRSHHAATRPRPAPAQRHRRHRRTPRPATRPRRPTPPPKPHSRHPRQPSGPNATHPASPATPPRPRPRRRRCRSCFSCPSDFPGPSESTPPVHHSLSFLFGPRPRSRTPMVRGGVGAQTGQQPPWSSRTARDSKSIRGSTPWFGTTRKGRPKDAAVVCVRSAGWLRFQGIVRVHVAAASLHLPARESAFSRESCSPRHTLM